MWYVVLLRVRNRKAHLKTFPPIYTFGGICFSLWYTLFVITVCTYVIIRVCVIANFTYQVGTPRRLSFTVCGNNTVSYYTSKYYVVGNVPLPVPVPEIVLRLYLFLVPVGNKNTRAYL